MRSYVWCMRIDRKCASTAAVRTYRSNTDAADAIADSQSIQQKHARSVTTEAALRELRGLIIAALRLVFVSLLRSHPRSTGRRSCGGPAFMILQMAILGAGVPGMGDIRDVLGITGTKDKRLSVGLRGQPSCPI
jgi:hypothetical protein